MDAAKAVGQSSQGVGDGLEPAWILGFKRKRTNLHEKYDHPSTGRTSPHRSYVSEQYWG
jgi:hypothetical protein